MKYLNFKAIAPIALASVLFTACEKKEKIDPIGDRGQTLVRILDGGTPGVKGLAIDFVNTATTIVVADIRRDVPSNADLMQPMTVTLQDDTALVSATGYTKLDPTWYTFTDGDGITKVGGEGGTYTVTFAPGEFAKEIRITIPDATVLDPSDNYGLGFRILSTSGGNITNNNLLVATIGAKNKYDGIYLMKGIHHRPPYNAFPYEQEMHMVTVGASSVRFFWPLAGDFGHPIGTATGVSWYGAAISPQVDFDPDTDLATDVYNVGSATPIEMYNDPAGELVSRYDEGTKTMYLYFFYYTGAGQDFSNRGWSDTLTYIGSR